MLNWALLREPINWVIVILMLLIGTFGLNLIMASAKGQGPLANWAGSGS